MPELILARLDLLGDYRHRPRPIREDQHRHLGAEGRPPKPKISIINILNTRLTLERAHSAVRGPAMRSTHFRFNAWMARHDRADHDGHSQPTEPSTPDPVVVPDSVVTPDPVVVPTEPSTPAAGDGMTALEHQFLDLINAARAEAGAPALTGNVQLAAAADAHSQSMLAGDYFSHTGSDGGGPGDRIEAAGFDASTWAENIAWVSDRGSEGIDAADIETLHENLMNSPGHRANLLNPDLEEIGIGLQYGDYAGWPAVMVTQDFGTDAVF
jgi:uncharacterized protein YkwD